MTFDYEVLIIGGGPAGLSAALSLGRMSRTALLCDDRRPRNARSSHVNNFATRDGTHPEEWRAFARRDLEKYPTIRSFEGSVLRVEKYEAGFRAELSSKETATFKKIILAYGVRDRLLSLPGFEPLWGKAIFHCPFCHGYEIRGSRIGLIYKNELAFHALPMIASLSPGLVVFTDGPAPFTTEQRDLLKRKAISVREERLERLRHTGERLEAVVLSSQEEIARDYLFYAAPMPFMLKSELGASLGCEKTEFGLYRVQDRGQTSVAGVFAAGDNMSPAHSVALAMASGAIAGAGVAAELIHEE